MEHARQGLLHPCGAYNTLGRIWLLRGCILLLVMYIDVLQISLCAYLPLLELQAHLAEDRKQVRHLVSAVLLQRWKLPLECHCCQMTSLSDLAVANAERSHNWVTSAPWPIPA